MNNFIKKINGIRLELICIASAIILLGLILIFKPTESQIFIFRGIGVLLCLRGLIRIITYFRTLYEEVLGSFGLVQGVSYIAFGIFFIINPAMLVSIFGTLIAIVILIDGILKIQYALDFHRMDSKHWWIDVIGAILMMILGIIAFFNPFTSTDMLMMFAGGVLVFEGVWDLVSITRISILARKIRKTIINIEKNAEEIDEVEEAIVTELNKED